MAPAKRKLSEVSGVSEEVDASHLSDASHSSDDSDDSDSSDTPSPSHASPRPSRRRRTAPSPCQTVWDAVMEAYPCDANQEALKGLADYADLTGLAARNPLVYNPIRAQNAAPFSIEGVNGHVNLLAACVQAGGIVRVDNEKCMRCLAGSGIWDSCVIAPSLPGRKTTLLGGACSCCHYNGKGRSCSFRPVTLQKRSTSTTFPKPSAAKPSKQASSSSYIPPPHVSSISGSPNPHIPTPPVSSLSGPRAPPTPPALPDPAPPALPAPTAPALASPTTIPSNPILEAHYRSISKAKRRTAQKQLEGSRQVLESQLTALSNAGKEIDDHTPIFADPILVASYRCISKTKRSGIQVHLQGALDELQSQLDAIEAADEEIVDDN
ncbi:hypothetical protein GGR54DRAFT_617804 [Hypoxylon sp. NC1633]|nr:hypothetical protein GGR54DRAFT_617804 [Hypoxylon sp. NC1633]